MTVHDAENHEEFEYVKFATIRTIDADEKAILFFGFEEEKKLMPTLTFFAYKCSWWHQEEGNKI